MAGRLLEIVLDGLRYQPGSSGS